MPHRARLAFDFGILVDVRAPVRKRHACWPESTYSHLCQDRRPPDPSVCMMPANQINLSIGTANIWWYDLTLSTWQTGVTPIPPIIYNRLSRRRVEQSRSGQKLIEALSKRALLFNHGFLRKDFVYHTLARQGLGHLIPPFTVLTEEKEAIAFYLDHHDIYLKPADGTLGRGIGRLKIKTNESHALVLNRWNVPGRVVRSMSKNELPMFFRRLKKQGLYVLQATVPLLQWRDRTVDLRVLVQKDASGRWQLTGAAGRVAPMDEITTHTLRGGERVSLETLMREADTPPPSVKALENVCLSAAQALEAYSKGEMAELSFDLGLLPSDHRLPVILEANAKPFPFDETVIREKARRMTMRYARFRLKTHHDKVGESMR